MKNQTKIKVTAIAAGFTLATFAGTFILASFNHPAQWYIGGACILGMIVMFAFGCSIDC